MQTVNTNDQQNELSGGGDGNSNSGVQADMRAHADVRGQAAPDVQSDVLPRARGFSPGLLLVTIAALVFLGALVAYGGIPRLMQQQELLSHKKAQLSKSPSVSVIDAQPGPQVQEFTLPGSTQAIQDALIYARVDGYIHGSYAEIGDKVRAGQVLADIDTPELDKQVKAAGSSVEQARAGLESAKEALIKATADLHSARANVRKARSDLNYFTVEVGRYKRLAGLGAVSEEERDTRTQAYQAGLSNLDAMEATERSAQASVNSAQASVHVAEAALQAASAQQEQFEATRSFRKVKALFDGVVTRRNVDAGVLVTSGSNSTNTVLFEIAKTDILRIFVYVPEQYVPYAHVGEKAAIKVQAFPNLEFTGTVTHVAGGLDPNSKTLQVEIHVPNKDHKLLPGMYAQVKFKAPTQTKLAVLPATTVKIRADGCFVYTVDRTNHVRLHKIAIARDLGGFFEIANGVNAGDRTVVNPPDDIHDGMLVEPVMAPTPEKTDGK